jgi:putative ABC transport system permease protein
MRGIIEILSTSWTAIGSHKLRSFLTVLGIVIGVAAVISLMSVGRGTQASMMERLSSLGTNQVTVRPGSSSEGGVRGAFGSASTLTFEDAEAIAAEINNITAVSPSSSSMSQVVAGSNNLRAQIQGVMPAYQIINNLEVADGAFIGEYEYTRKSKSAMIGSTVSETLYGEGVSPVGEKIRMMNTVFIVTGLLESQGESMTSADNSILIPLSTLLAMTDSKTTGGEYSVNTITVQAADSEYIDRVKEDITLLLEQRHGIGIGEEDDFTVTSSDEMTEAITESMNQMTLLLGAIAGISLLVGGIGVMNIMLVSVMERRKEIGIRKALGAKERDIWGQFLLDSALLTFAGGIIGISAGWGGSMLIARIGGLTTAVTMDIVVLAVAVSVCIGLFFGFYPAWQGSKLDPIEALRAE